MIERSGGRIELNCDECGDSPGRSFDKDDFDIMIDHAKHEGWRIFKEGKQWLHHCPDCRDDR